MLLFTIGDYTFRWVDLLDFTLVIILLYQFYRLLRGGVAVRIFIGFVVVYVTYLLVRAIGLRLLSNILGQFISVGVIAALILFQQEIRRFLMMIGKGTFLKHLLRKSLKTKKNRTPERKPDIQILVSTAKNLSKNNYGALIVLNRNPDPEIHVRSGIQLDAVLSKQLLICIFEKHSPLHDGAVVIENNRIRAAGCVLPVTERENLPASYGLRHRAAIGLTEVSDSLVLVISEESGKISTVRDGEVTSNILPEELEQILRRFLYGGQENDRTHDADSERELKVKPFPLFLKKAPDPEKQVSSAP